MNSYRSYQYLFRGSFRESACCRYFDPALIPISSQNKRHLHSRLIGFLLSLRCKEDVVQALREDRDCQKQLLIVRLVAKTLIALYLKHWYPLISRAIFINLDYFCSSSTSLNPSWNQLLEMYVIVHTTHTVLTVVLFGHNTPHSYIVSVAPCALSPSFCLCVASTGVGLSNQIRRQQKNSRPLLTYSLYDPTPLRPPPPRPT